MASLKSISAAIESIPSKKETLRKSFEQLQSHSSFLSSFTLQWKDLEDHFDAMEKSIEKRFKDLESAERQQQKSIEKRFKDLESAERQQPAVAAAAVIDSEPSGPVIWPQLKTFCSKMDGKGLRSFIVAHRKDGPEIRDELNAALLCASDPAKLVLDAMEGFYPPKSRGDKDVELAALRRVCSLLLERLGEISPEIKEPAKERAKKLAVEWKGKIREGGDSLLESMAFFQLLATFGLVSLFDSDELLDIVVIIARRRHTIELCRKLGLEEKIPDLIEKLIRKGKQLDAINFAYAFELVGKFPPVPLLKGYLKEAKKAGQEVRRKGNNSIQSLNESTAKEISALTAVIKSVEDHKLQSEYSCEGIVKRINMLEKLRADRKRTAASKQQQQPTNKRPRSATMTSDTGPPLLAYPPQSSGLLVDHLNPYSGSAGLYGLAGGASAGSGSTGLYSLAGRSGTAPAVHAMSGGPGSSGLYSLSGGHGAALYDIHQGSGTHGAYGGNRTPPRSHLLHAEGLSSSLYDKPISYGGYPMSGGVPPQYHHPSYYP